MRFATTFTTTMIRFDRPSRLSLARRHTRSRMWQSNGAFLRHASHVRGSKSLADSVKTGPLGRKQTARRRQRSSRCSRRGSARTLRPRPRTPPTRPLSLFRFLAQTPCTWNNKIRRKKPPRSGNNSNDVQELWLKQRSPSRYPCACSRHPAAVRAM